MSELWNILSQLIVVLGKLLGLLVEFALSWLLLIVWVVWWLFGVNWKKAWPVLAQGAWVPVLLLMVTAALVGSRLVPGTSFWWQLGAVSLLVALALFCGWLQGVFHWAPAEIELEPPAAGQQGHGHEHH